MKETKKNKDSIACLDPEAITISVIQLHPDYAVNHVARAMQQYSKVKYLMGAHNTGGHWILLNICLEWDLVFYVDSSRPISAKGKLRSRDYSVVKQLLDT
jgi:hypothetical protein